MQNNRLPIITGNWKMYKTLEEARSFVKDLTPAVNDLSFKVYLAVPFTFIFPLAEELGESPIILGGQNMNDVSEGAFTGEIAARMLTDVGAKFVLLGHSERRRLYHEDNAFIHRKVNQAVKSGIQPILCVGETKEEYEAGQSQDVVRKQITECLEGIPAEKLSNLVLAYEPAWAIGTGYSATPEIAQNMHLFCRQVIGEAVSSELAATMIIQYGGSVNPSNAKELLSQPDVDGLLIGGASLSLESFKQIIHDSESILNQRIRSI